MEDPTDAGAFVAENKTSPGFCKRADTDDEPRFEDIDCGSKGLIAHSEETPLFSGSQFLRSQVPSVLLEEL